MAYEGVPSRGLKGRMTTESDTCELCGLKCKTTKHHLIPQQVSRHKNKYLKTDESNFLWICRECHSQIHAMFTNHELKESYCTKDALLGNERFHAFVDWRRKHPDFSGSAKMSRGRK